MADVTPPWHRVDQDADRGQLFLIGALSLAVLLISVALLLNTAIYTENIATRSGGTDSAEVIGFQSAAQTQSVEEFEHVNREHNASYGDVRENYTASMESWEDTAASHRAAEGHVGAVTVNNTTEGTRIVQDVDRNFTDANTNADWELVADGNARNHTITVDRESLAETDLNSLLANETFHVNFTAGSDVWTVYVYDDDDLSNAVNVTVRDQTGSIVGGCEVSTDRARIDVTGATINGTSCSPLQFFDELGDNYDVSYGSTDHVQGTYSLVVDRNVSSVDGTQYNDDETGDSPYVTPALYDAEIDLVYHTQTAYYEAKYRVAPGEPDA